jgi:hypothetical protein
MVLNQDAETITVSWTEPTGETIPARYNIRLSNYNGSSLSANAGETSVSFEWGSYYQSDGEYVASVQAVDLSYGSYFKESDYAVSAGQRFENLFGSTSSPAADVDAQITNTTNTITGFATRINFSSAKPEVTYTVERAPVDVAGNAGTYAAVSVYKNTSATAALGTADLTADVLGNLPNSTVYDKSVPVAGGKFKYRIKATKGTVTKTKEIYDVVTIDPRNYANLSITMGAPTAATGNSTTYSVTPSIFKGALQADDKLVIYYVKGSSSYGYQNGPYVKGLEFSKTELEAATVTSKTLTIPGPTIANGYVFVQAYIEPAGGTVRQNVNPWSYSDAGVSSSNSYYQSSINDYIYYAELNY